MTSLNSIQALKDYFAEMRVYMLTTQFLVGINHFNRRRRSRSVEGDGAITGFTRDLHPEEARRCEQLLLADEGFILKRDAKVLKDFSEEETKGKKLVKVVVCNKREDDGGVVDGKRRINTIDKVKEVF